MSAFDNNYMTSLDLGHGVKTIGNWAFEHNDLTSVTVPSTAPSGIYIAFDPNVTITRK